MGWPDTAGVATPGPETTTSNRGVLARLPSPSPGTWVFQGGELTVTGADLTAEATAAGLAGERPHVREVIEAVAAGLNTMGLDRQGDITPAIRAAVDIAAGAQVPPGALDHLALWLLVRLDPATTSTWSLAEELVHVFRGGAEIGSLPIVVPSSLGAANRRVAGR